MSEICVKLLMHDNNLNNECGMMEILLSYLTKVVKVWSSFIQWQS